MNWTNKGVERQYCSLFNGRSNVSSLASVVILNRCYKKKTLFLSYSKIQTFRVLFPRPEWTLRPLRLAAVESKSTAKAILAFVVTIEWTFSVSASEWISAFLQHLKNLRFSDPLVREQRDHQAQRGGRHPEAQDQVVEEGARWWSLPGSIHVPMASIIT